MTDTPASDLESSGTAADESFDDTPIGAGPEQCASTETEASTATDWIQIELLGEDDEPVVGQPYRIELADGSIMEGRIGAAGFVRIDGIDSGTCTVSFPDLDKSAWDPI